MKKFISIMLVLSILLVPAAVLAEEEKAPVVVLKFDDVVCNNASKLDTFEKVVMLLLEEDVVGSFGVIGGWCQQGTSDSQKATFNTFWNNLKKYIRCGMEIWSHGWNHDSSGEGDHEFNHMFTDEQVKERFAKVLKLVEENADGYKITTFGAPYNRTDDNAAITINENFPQITAVFRSMKDDNTVNRTFNAVVIGPIYGIDGGFDDFMKNYKPGNDVVALQGHPTKMSAETIEDIRKIISYFKEQGSVFMTPSQYAEFVKNLEVYRKDDGNKIALLCDNTLLMSDVSPYIANGRTMVPVRIISENLDAKVDWDGENQIVKIERYGDLLELKIGSETAIFNGKELTLDSPAQIQNGRTMVPLRFIAEALGAEISWDDARRMVIINK